MREIEWKVLSELMKNSKLSDRELARKLGSSQPTVTRTRRRLEEKGYIKLSSNSIKCLTQKKLKKQRRPLLRAPKKAQG